MLSGSAVAQLEEPIIPDFAAEPISGPAPLTVNFTDETDYGSDFDPDVMDVSFLWDFGDNQTEEGEEFAEVSHVYEDEGLYTVALNVTITENGTEIANGSVLKDEYIEVLAAPVDDGYPVVNFTAEPLSGNASLNVTFTDLSDFGPDFDSETMNISYLWDFGDNNTEEGEDFADVSHTYEDEGLYTVALNVTVTENGTEVANGSATKEDYIEVLAALVEDDYPLVNFTADPLSGDAPLNVNFTDLSDFGPDFDPGTANLTRFWEFGDGNNFTSTEATGAYTYEGPGIYNVTLTLFYAEDNDTLNRSLTKEAYIEVLEGEPSPVEEYPKLDFIGEPRAGVAPLSVNFTPIVDLGPDFDPVNMTVEGLWEFGDGSNSTEMNVTHVYETPGIYDVTATINIIEDGNTTATESITKEQYIKVFDSDAKGIMLSPGWNFISVPYVLNNSSVDFLFADVEYESIIYYDAASEIWLDVEELEPLKGYMVYALDFGMIPLDKLARVEDPIPGVPGASIPIYEGWNAIGFTDSTESLSAEFTLEIINDSYFEVVGPLNQATLTYAYIGRNGYEGEIGASDDKYVGTDIFLMEPYEGYWILATENTTLYAVGW
ncbi:MAG: PKD domain-containing protein [Methanosarcinaceae archaeon]